MKIYEFKVGELPALLEDKLFRTSTTVPITPLRCLSQYHNPRANPEDTALLVALDEEGELISYVGCLPDQLLGDTTLPVAWNSCWWRDAEKGKRIALPLLLRAIEIWKGRMLFDDLPQHSKQILEQIGGFGFREMEGLRCFLSFKFHKILPRKRAWLRRTSWLLRGVDQMLNFTWRKLKVWQWRRTQIPKSSKRLVRLTKLDTATQTWLAQRTDKELIGRSSHELNWILEYPWLSTTSTTDNCADRYYFSSVATHFEYLVYQLWEADRLQAVLFFTNRDAQFKLPYVYFESAALGLVVESILEILVAQAAESFVCFQKDICAALAEQTTPFYYQKKIQKTFGFTKALAGYVGDNPVIQDGDGDWVFT